MDYLFTRKLKVDERPFETVKYVIFGEKNGKDYVYIRADQYGVYYEGRIPLFVSYEYEHGRLSNFNYEFMVRRKDKECLHFCTSLLRPIPKW